MTRISFAPGAAVKPCDCPGCVNRPQLDPKRWDRDTDNHSWASRVRPWEQPGKGKATGARLAKRAAKGARKAQGAE